MAHSGSQGTPPVVGFVGLGTMGGPMCRRLIGAGYAVDAFDLDDVALGHTVDAGARAGASARDCAARADIFLTSLPRPDHVETVMAGDEGALAALRSGSMWIDLTTNRRDLILELARAAPTGVDVVDSPVTGAVDGARQGRLTLFAGGAPEPVERARHVLDHLGLVIECGPLGTGNVVKLVTNQLWFVAAAALGEGFATGIANGVDLDTLWYAIKESVADSFVARHDAPGIFAGHYDPSFTLDLCLKDLDLLRELYAAVATDLPMTEAADRTFRRAADRYGTAAGELHVAKRIEDDTGLSMRLAGDWTPPWEQ
jgi:3-hydroxyisobutyrate dehydrogenase/2-hydroxy-3-oxopropionate reductase